MKLLIFGAAGRTGRHLVRQAILQHHVVTAFVRSPADFEMAAANLAVFTGNVSDPAAILRAMKEQDAVISVLGVSRPRRSDPSVMQGIRDIIQAMRQRGVRRLVYLSCAGVTEARDQAGPYLRWIHGPRYAAEIADHEQKEAMVKASGLDWTIVRAPALTNGQRSGKYRSGERIAGGVIPRLSRADVAEFVLKQVTDTSFLQKSPSVMP